MPVKRHSQPDSTPRKAVNTSSTIANPSSSASSISARKKASSSSSSSSSAPSRTGQACDRCKTRKIRCDNTPGGCLPCRQNNTECRTTDRITHRATARGHTEALEHQNFLLSEQIKSLEQQVVELGGKPKVFPYFGGSSAGQRLSTDTVSSGGNVAATWRSDSSGPVESSAAQTANRSRGTSKSDDTVGIDEVAFALPLRPSEESPERRLGLSAFRSGTSLSLFEMHIDLAEFMTDQRIDPHGPRSYTKLFEIVTIGTRQGSEWFKADLPATYEECLQYAELYLSTGNNFQPVLHPPKLRDIVWRIYNRDYRMSYSESAVLHCILAWIKFQIAARDTTSQKQTLNVESDTHYHKALSQLHYLLMGRTLEDLQAMTLICLHVRNFPDSSTAWMTLHRVLSTVIEAGFHRKVGPPPPNATAEEIRVLECRKRIFWVLFSMMTSISGKMGRPMPIRADDFDVELPEALNEDLEALEAGSEPTQCSYYFAIQLFKLVRITNEIYNTIYAVRPVESYDQALHRFEKALVEYKEQIPYCWTEEVAVVPTQDRSRILALWLQRQYAEVRLVLHHPALCRSTSPEIFERNLNMAVDASYQLIRFSAELCALNGLDTTWYNTTALIAAIFLLLFAAEKRGQNSPEDMLKLQNIMRDCLTMCGSIGEMLGSGPRLRNKMAGIIDKALERIANVKPPQASNGPVPRAKESPKPSPNIGQAFKQSDIPSAKSQPRGAVRREGSSELPASSRVAGFSELNTMNATQANAGQNQTTQPQTQSSMPHPPTQYTYDPYSAQSIVYQQPPVSRIDPLAGTQAYSTQRPPDGPSEWQQWTMMACQPQPITQPEQGLSHQPYISTFQMPAAPAQGTAAAQNGAEATSQQGPQSVTSSANPLFYNGNPVNGFQSLNQNVSNLVPVENMSLAASVNRRWPLAAWSD